MGHYCHISSNCSFLGGAGTVTMGDFVNIGPGCSIVTAGHDYRYGGLNGPAIPTEYKGHSSRGDISFSDHVLIGANTVILPGVELPEGTAIGALSLVKEGVYKQWTVYAGVPAVEIGPRDKTHILEHGRKLLDRLDVN